MMMSSDSPTPSANRSDKRDELRAKIEASERRIAERTLADQAEEVIGAASSYVKQNPLTVLGGAIAVGILIGAMTKPGRRAARNAATGAVGAVGGAADAVGGAASGAAKSVGSAARKRGNAFGALLADAIVAYGIKLIDEAMDTARSGKEAAEDISDSASAKARELRREASYAAGTAADKTRTVTRRTRRRAERAVRDLTDRVSN
ncbi:hypothetical protein [Erythrobacter sp. Alg231-14]|uniref:hypothetical protein n=1 Tax=Erythrobacter sp. Alg231-14 TaxID=1922225 RepID=UPI000D55C7C1